MNRLCIYALFLLLIVTVSTSAQESSDNYLPPDSVIKISIDKIDVNDGKLYDTIAVKLYSPEVQLGGFDLKLGWNSDLFDIIRVDRGELYTDCLWEFFNNRESQLSENLIPDGVRLLQLVGLADMAGDTSQPQCFHFSDEITICRLIVAGRGLGSLPDTTVPLFFFWEDCSDNTISGKSGNRLYISKAVTDVLPGKPDLSKDRFPTESGTPKECIKGVSTNPPNRIVSFINGGIRILFTTDTLETDTL